jgi:hypothetical protein
MRLATTIAFLLVAAPAGARLPDAYQRSRNKLSIVDRELEQRRPNTGAAGRKNATRDDARQGELPWLQPKPLSGW